MPGRLRTSYRFGNLAEHLGILLLKGIAAVAEVPRTEDVGLDAVANLLRRDQDGNCYAEDGFVVQLKSHSTTLIEYREHALSWLIGQSQPVFLGRVSLSDASISLYSTLRVNQAVFARGGKNIQVCFDKSTIERIIVVRAMFESKLAHQRKRFNPSFVLHDEGASRRIEVSSKPMHSWS
jgi:hypothetical protein